jgi:hypothetical protein
MKNLSWLKHYPSHDSNQELLEYETHYHTVCLDSAEYILRDCESMHYLTSQY